jgi:hypothetical protein
VLFAAATFSKSAFKQTALPKFFKKHFAKKKATAADSKNKVFLRGKASYF